MVEWLQPLSSSSLPEDRWLQESQAPGVIALCGCLCATSGLYHFDSSLSNWLAGLESYQLTGILAICNTGMMVCQYSGLLFCHPLGQLALISLAGQLLQSDQERLLYYAGLGD